MDNKEMQPTETIDSNNTIGTDENAAGDTLLNEPVAEENELEKLNE